MHFSGTTLLLSWWYYLHFLDVDKLDFGNQLIYEVGYQHDPVFHLKLKLLKKEPTKYMKPFPNHWTPGNKGPDPA